VSVRWLLRRNNMRRWDIGFVYRIDVVGNDIFVLWEGSTFCPIHPRESSVSRGNSCSGIRNSRFVEVRLSTRYGTMISNQRTSTLVHADTHTGLSCAWSLFKYDCSLIRYRTTLPSAWTRAKIQKYRARSVSISDLLGKKVSLLAINFDFDWM